MKLTRKYQRDIAKRMEALRASVEPYKPRPEHSMAEVLHRAKVVARKRQIALMKLENEEIPWQPGNIMMYTRSEARKKVWSILKGYMRLLLP